MKSMNGREARDRRSPGNSRAFAGHARVFLAPLSLLFPCIIALLLLALEEGKGDRKFEGIRRLYTVPRKRRGSRANRGGEILSTALLLLLRSFNLSRRRGTRVSILSPSFRGENKQIDAFLTQRSVRRRRRRRGEIAREFNESDVDR